MKIFVSYSRRDSGDFAKQIYESLKDEHEVFTDVSNIQVGDVWSNIIDDNIATCNIFIVIVTFAALRSPEVEKEVLLAKKKNKTIIPCFYRGISRNQIKWELEKFQGIEFGTTYELARETYSKIQEYRPRPEPTPEPLQRNRPPRYRPRPEPTPEPLQRNRPPKNSKLYAAITIAIAITIGFIFVLVFSHYGQ